MLKVHTQKLGEVTILRLQGRIVTGETEVLHNAVLSQSNASEVVLDFARVKDIDARGLGVLLQLREHALSNGIKLRLTSVTELVLRLLEISCLNTVFEVSPEAEVLSKTSRNPPPNAVMRSTSPEA